MVKTGKSILLILFIVSCVLVEAQISAPGKDSGFKAEYPSNKGSDSVFIFNKPAFESERIISLLATSTDRSSGWSFIWAVYNYTSRSWEIIPKADIGMISTLDTITITSGYRVIMTKGAVSDTFIVWTLFNDFNVEILNKDDTGSVIFGDYNCNSVSLRADTTVYHMSYPEPGVDTVIPVTENYTLRWKASNEESNLPSNRFITRVEGPPYKDTWYTLTVTDFYNLSRSDSVLCPAISSKASMTAEYVPLSDSLEYADRPYKYYYKDDSQLSAPGKYRFDISGSENSESFQIKFGDGDMIETQTDTDKLVHEYRLPGKYTATLITQSPAPFGCIDSIEVENIIELNPAEIKLPNVFTPNNDGKNDIAKLYEEEDNDAFRSKDVSIVVIEITIFNRIGKKVHAYKGNIRDWTGWDGTVMDSNREAPDGVYFYCVTYNFFGPEKENAVKLIYRQEEKTGFIHLYRE
jgi:gliding motility-associated-like protein